MFDGLLDVCLVSIYSFAKKDGAMRGRAEHAKKKAIPETTCVSIPTSLLFF